MSVKPFHLGLAALGLLVLILVVVMTSGESEADLRFGVPLDAATARTLPEGDRLRRVVLELDRRMSGDRDRHTRLPAAAQPLAIIQQQEGRLAVLEFTGPTGEGIPLIIALSEAYRTIGATRYADTLQACLGESDTSLTRFRARWMTVWNPVESQQLQLAYLNAHLDDILPPR